MAQQTVLVAVDDSTERGEKQARLVCDLFDPGRVDVVLHHNFPKDAREADLQSVESVQAAESILREGDFDVELEETVGNAGTAVVDTAERFDVDVICLYARRRSPTGKVLFGSVAQDVIMSTNRPVLLAPKE